MEQEIYFKQKKFEEEAENFIQKYVLCRKIVTTLTDVVCTEAKSKTFNEQKELWKTVNKNLDIFTEIFEHCNRKIDNSMGELVPIKSDLTMFTYKKPDIEQYTPNTIGECVITKIRSGFDGQCFMNDLTKPKPELQNVCKRKLISYPQSGEVFAVDLGDLGLLRAVRDDLIFKPRPKIILYLLDIGKRVEILYDLQRFYSLPEEYQSMESRAIPCRVVKLIGPKGVQLDVEGNLQDALQESAYFQVKNIEDNILWINLCLKKKVDELNNEGDEIDSDDDENRTRTTVSVAPYSPNSPHSVADNNEIPYTFNEALFTDALPHILNPNMKPSAEMEVEEPEFTCYLCHSVFATKFDIETHMKLHICIPIPTERVEQQLKKKKGQLKKFEKVNSLICNICDAVFSQKAHLKYHVQNHKFTCKLCDEFFHQIPDFELHVNTHHKDKKFSICSTCGKMFSSNGSLEKHSNIHTKEISYPCTKCEKIFFNRNTLRSHLKSHSDQKFECSYCGKEFSLKSNLTQHLKSHIGEKSFVCNICDKRYTRKRDLKLHLAIHTGPKRNW